MRSALHNDQPNFHRKPEEANSGLWYDKFCNMWDIKESDNNTSLSHWTLGTIKEDWIKSVANSPDDNGGRMVVGDQGLLRSINRRMERLADLHLNVKPLLFSTQWRFVTGLGREHPAENGFAWHHTLGTPYLPGSSIKGMMRAWAKQWANVGDTVTDRIFGPDRAGCVGSVIFYDALPIGPVQLEVDVMTPHYAPWYGNGETPGDWYDPIPIPFLVVAPEQTFQFIVAPRKSDENQANDDVSTVRDWLKEALEWIGAGAKTAVGYGRFGEVKKTCPWVDEKLKEIAKTNHCPPEEALRGRVLAKAWEELDDASLKAEALEDIRSRWQEKEWWETPQGKAMKQAKNIYDGED